MQLYYIRHAQSENNAILERNGYKSEEGRHADPQITTMGFEQAKLLAEFLARENPEAEI
ncbi:MAG TPA: histidine phosphatase family protein, partial [Anaerolineaceae bacterium]|nr:histidine phosphatase family protein [Anaerolineaceae bacterium]